MIAVPDDATVAGWRHGSLLGGNLVQQDFCATLVIQSAPVFRSPAPPSVGSRLSGLT